VTETSIERARVGGRRDADRAACRAVPTQVLARQARSHPERLERYDLDVMHGGSEFRRGGSP
jgi:hypothetical protein